MRRILVAVFIIITFAADIFPQTKYFYTGKDYGSEANFNPLTFIVNSGFDIVQQESYTRKIFTIDYSSAGKKLTYILSHPLQTINGFGRNKFIKTQIFPGKIDNKHLEWVPNYTLHILGMGTSFTALREWYEYHKIPMPYLMSILTLYSGHFLNELVEISNRNYKYNVDPVADIYIFDVVGVALFSFDFVNKFCSETLHMADWSYQPSFSFPNVGLENVGQCFAVKVDLPYINRWSLFSHFGNGSVFGLSYKFNREEAISAGAGLKMRSVKLEETNKLMFPDPTWEIGFFYDRNNSLMASMILSGTQDYFCNINIYPGIVKLGDFSPGLWTVINKKGKIMLGFSTRYLIGGAVKF